MYVLPCHLLVTREIAPLEIFKSHFRNEFPFSCGKSTALYKDGPGIGAEVGSRVEFGIREKEKFGKRFKHATVCILPEGRRGD